MGVKMASGCLKLSQPSIQLSPSPAPAIRRILTDVAPVYGYVHRSAIFGTKLNRSPSFVTSKISRGQLPAKRAVSASLDVEFSDEEFSKKIQDFSLRFRFSDETETNTETQSENPFAVSKMEPPDWPENVIPGSIERRANSVELPFSLRIIKRKKQWKDGFREAGESAYCSMKKAFSSMVFIIRELQSYSLQMREILFFEDLQGILVRVQKEMNASFVWLFQQVFSQTPTLMVYVMILLANYSVHSMSSNVAFAAAAPPPATVEYVSSIQNQSPSPTKFDSSTFSVNSGGKTISVDGNNGGGGKFRPVASGTEGDGRFDGSVDYERRIVPDGASMADPGAESVSGRATRESDVWGWMVDEADKMQDVIREGGLDHETMKRLVSPIRVKIEEEDGEDHFRTELLYQTGLSQEPDNPLLLANYAQFLYLVAHDYDRAEEYFKRASNVEPKDAEALSKYASFLWRVRNDMWAAEETFLEAISADPTNSFYAANYAHFLWNTGAEDTCFPLDSPEITDI